MKVNKEIWNLLEKKLEEFPHIKCENSIEAQIQEIEKKIGIKINEQFKFFLKNYECQSIGSLEIFIINNDNSWSVLEANYFFKIEDEWPDIEDWLIISDDGSGNPIGILPNGEIWTSDHDNGFKKYKLANDFEEFVYKLLTETLWDD